MQLLSVEFKPFLGAPRPEKITYQQDDLPALHDPATVSDGHGDWDCEVCGVALGDAGYIVTHRVLPPSAKQPMP